MTDTTWKISLLGGLKRRGLKRIPEHTIVITGVGGADLDLTGATPPGDRFTLTKVSLAGGVKLAVPAGVRVEVKGFHPFGRHVERGTEDSGAPVFKVRAYTLFGGVRIRRTV
ncbi:hypothetical protein FHR32_003658 [Streptosporangium album]|uniref:Cell wall-active antibiotics response LiaF-like C-terminal domain-containing protein n=1 Tax=Streptosporangium album TaxID=47479 RepID=A0A7W7RXE2_9ACTN|nr:hypothetical protein [Streptosporangium album]MBB4939353.1 hypothetical protein [Streptosporangium album]